MNEKVIDREKLQKISFTGLSDEIKGLRPLVWRILLNHLPLETERWEEHLVKSKEIYDTWKDELIIQPDLKIKQLTDEKDKQNRELIKKEH